MGEWLDCRARITAKEHAPLHSVKNGILQNGCSTSQKKDADLGKSALVHTARLTNSLAKGLKRIVTKVHWLWWKLHDNLVAYFKIWSCRSLQRFCAREQTYWNQSDVFDSLKPCYVMLTFETRIHRSEWFAQVILISATPTPQNLRIGLKKRRNGKSDVPREAAWKLAKNILKLKEKHKTAFFSPSENWCLPAPSTPDLEEREFVVDSGASMHMISTKDLNDAEMDTLTTSRSPTTVNNSQWWSANACRGHSSCQRIGDILDNEKSSRIRQRFYR